MDDTIFVSGHGSQPEYTLADERCAPTDADAPTPLHDHRGQDAHIKVISSVRLVTLCSFTPCCMWTSHPTDAGAQVARHSAIAELRHIPA
jgi:hypothetical protein